jgi:membrane protein DedA with SNARE-associated domain
LAIGVAVLTPGVRTAVIPACGLAGVPMRVFLPGLVLGSGADLGLHFAIGYAGAGILSALVSPSPIILLVAFLAVGLAAWLVIARRRRASRSVALQGWVQATCPVCLVLGSVASLETEAATPGARLAVR